ncbi:hypothetical protein VTJ83DRAFT_7268 [Remersonia thermophila]|uniref:BZIP domain-containing protein n=1 Tax=Remersonia thermophila TaxID=72144 RepID=A0ABR4D302_9PEZI
MGPPTDAVVRDDDKSQSPKQRTNSSTPPQEPQTDAKRDVSPVKQEHSSNPEPPKLPAVPPPPPRPNQPGNSKSPDYFEKPPAPSLSLEPNPFEQSFGGAPSGAETPGGTKLPPVAALTSPSSLLPGNTPFWGSSLRQGPLSPAMLSGPTSTDYFGDTHHIRSFPTPNESSLRTGLTPGGSGSMFPAAPSPSSLFQLGGSVPTPGILDFHRTALSAAAKREQAQAPQQQPPTSVPPTSHPTLGAGDGLSKTTESKAPPGPFDPHDNDAANGLFMLAQGRPSVPAPLSQYPSGPLTQPSASAAGAGQPIAGASQLNGGPSLPGPGASEAGAASGDAEPARPSTRGKKRSISGAAGSSRRKAEESNALAKEPPSKKGRTATNGSGTGSSSDDRHSADEQQNGGKDQSGGGSTSKSKMTDEEKRKNFLERNRVAALKCRQRKKQWLASLQQKVESFSQENENLVNEIESLRAEIVNLKAILLQHKNCSVSQQQRQQEQQQQTQQPQQSSAAPMFLQQQAAALDFNPPLDAYAMAAGNPMGGQPMVTSQPVAAGQGMNRRFS